MDVRQLSTQIGAQPAGGSPLGSVASDNGFSTILQSLSSQTGGSRGLTSHAAQSETDEQPSSASSAVSRGPSRKADGRRGRKSHVAESEADDRPSHAAPAATRGLSRKSEGSRGTKSSRAAQPETDAQPSSAVSAGAHALSRKADSRADAESHDHQTKTDDGSSTATSEAPATLSPTTSAIDTEPSDSQAKSDDAPSTTTSGSDPLQLSLSGATMVTQAAPIASAQTAAGTDASATQADGHNGSADISTVQPLEGGASPVGSAIGLSKVAGDQAAAATEAVVDSVHAPMSEGQALTGENDRVTQAGERSDLNQPITAVQEQEAESRKLQQGVLSLQQQHEVPAAPAVSGQAVAQGQSGEQPSASAEAQQAGQNHETVVAPPDQSQTQQILGKGEPSLHQKNMQSESSAAQAAAVLSGHMQAEGQGLNAESDGQRKEEGLKWFSRADLQSAEVSSRPPQPSANEASDAGLQSLPYQQGQGGAPSTIKTAPAQPASSLSQANRLGPDPDVMPVPGTHSVQFDLSPADFGQLRVRVVLSDQTVHTHLSTDRAELGQLLTSQQEQLNTQLSGAGLDLGRFHVQVNQERTNQSGQEWQSPAHGGTSQQQRESRQQDHSSDVPVAAQPRTGKLSVFA